MSSLFLPLAAGGFRNLTGQASLAVVSRDARRGGYPGTADYVTALQLALKSSDCTP